LEEEIRASPPSAEKSGKEATARKLGRRIAGILRKDKPDYTDDDLSRLKRDNGYVGRHRGLEAAALAGEPGRDLLNSKRREGGKLLSDNPKEAFEKYSEEDVPLKSYAAEAAFFNLLFAVALLLAKASGRGIPDGVKLSDIVLFGVASHKVSWLVAKDGITSPLRAPFTKLDEIESPTNFQESPRGTGLQRSLGELLTCHFCLGQWVASFFIYGLLLAPKTTRLVGSLFAIATLSDHLHQTYQSLMKRA